MHKEPIYFFIREAELWVKTPNKSYTVLKATVTNEAYTMRYMNHKYESWVTPAKIVGYYHNMQIYYNILKSILRTLINDWTLPSCKYYNKVQSDILASNGLKCCIEQNILCKRFLNSLRSTWNGKLLSIHNLKIVLVFHFQAISGP